jgi:hypothetical protein
VNRSPPHGSCPLDGVRRHEYDDATPRNVIVGLAGAVIAAALRYRAAAGT